MNELLELIKAFNADKDIRVTINYYAPLDVYEIEMREYDYAHYAAYHVKKRIRVDDLLSAKIPTNEVFVKLLNNMYEELKRGVKDERESGEASEGQTRQVVE